MKRFLVAAAALASFALCVHAEIFRCTAAAGAITYQEIPCPDSAQSRTMDIPSQFPEVNRRERERLLEREAAMQDRLLKRMEIEAAERIARDDRLSREAALREALARREAAEQPAAAGPGILVVQPFRPPRVHRPIRHGPRLL